MHFSGKWAVLPIIFFLFTGFAGAATISGNIFDSTDLEPLNNAIVSINSSPKQTIVATNAYYSFDVSPGNYSIAAKYFEDGNVLLEAEEKLTVSYDGNFRLDLVMFPPLSFDENFDEFFEDDPIDENDFVPNPSPEESTDGFLLPAFFLLLVLAGIFAFWLKNRGNNSFSSPKGPLEEKKPVEKINGENQVQKPHEEKVVLDKHAQEVLEVLKKAGGRITQKELREKVNLGEAYVSLIVTELESEGLVKKIRQGRGNIIILKNNNQKTNEVSSQ